MQECIKALVLYETSYESFMVSLYTHNPFDALMHCFYTCQHNTPKRESTMEMIATKETVCPGCGRYIEKGQYIQPYGGQWYHSTCDFPRLGQGGVSRHVQQRNERIKKYHSIHHWMSIRELAEYLGESKSTVHRVLASKQ